MPVASPHLARRLRVLAAGFNGLAHILAEPIDLGIVDNVSNWLASGTAWLSSRLGRLQSGFVRNYALMVFLGVVAIMSFIIFR